MIFSIQAANNNFPVAFLRAAWTAPECCPAFQGLAVLRIQSASVPPHALFKHQLDGRFQLLTPVRNAPLALYVSVMRIERHATKCNVCSTHSI